MTNRDRYLQRLTDAINKREEVDLTVAQVNHYIGCDMNTSELCEWTIDTESGKYPVSYEDVMSLQD